MEIIHETETLETMVVTGSHVDFPYDRDRVAWWLRSPGNNDNNAAFVYGDDGNVNDNGNNVKNAFGVRPALPGCPKCMEGSMRQCIGQRNPVPFLRKSPREKHMLSETLDARAFKALGVGDAPFPRQPIEKIKSRRLKHEKKTETVDWHPAYLGDGAGTDAGDESDCVCGG